MSLAAVFTVLALYAPLPSAHVVLAPCPEIAQEEAGCALADGTVYVPREWLHGSLSLAAQLVGHELGHEWDFQHLTDAEHARLGPMLGATGPWDWQGEGPSPGGAATPGAERFADAYALCAMSPTDRALWRDRRGYVAMHIERIARRAVANVCWLLHHRP